MIQLQTTSVRTRFQCLNLIEAYREGESGGYRTFEGLKKKGIVGQYYAGEFALQMASDSSGTAVGDWLNLADDQLKSSTFNKNLNDINDNSSVAARAVIRYTQMPLHKLMIAKAQLPRQDIAQVVYEQTAARAKQFTGILKASRLYRSSENQADMNGVIGETSVLLLGQRAAQRIGTKNWFPLQSLILEDHACRFYDRKSKGWDINVFTHLNSDDPIERPYKVQVKTSEYYDTTTIDEPDISRVTIKPDLVVNNIDSYWLAAQIVGECDFEIRNPMAAASRVTPLLDRRTDKLLTQLDA